MPRPSIFIANIALITCAIAARAQGASEACGLRLASGDSARYVALSRSIQAPGSLREGVDSTGRLSYAFVWFFNNDTWTVDGTVRFSNGIPTDYAGRVRRNDAVLVSESVQAQGDSLIANRNGRTATFLRRGLVPVPSLIYAPVRMLLLQCALHRSDHQLETSRYGRVHALQAASITIRAGARSSHVRLFLLWTDIGGIVARGWVNDREEILAYPGAEGEVDLIRPEWKAARNQLITAEVQASSPNCHFGDGPGGCENTGRICNLPTATPNTSASVRLVTISDSGYSVHSDGKGPYVKDSMNVVIPGVGPVAGMLLETTPSRLPARSFFVDLDHPVPGDIGERLGIVSADGRFPGKFNPSGTSPRNELVAHANTDWDEKQHPLSEIPLGVSVQLDQIDLDFYINGVLHILQMGPQPYGHCQAGGTAVFGDGTTRGSFSHPDADHWVIDLPPGSVGRLFANQSGDATAVNRGLYYVSLHIVLQR